VVLLCTYPIATQWFEGKRDTILFCIDCSEAMQESRDDPVYEGVQTSHLLEALDAAMKIQKRKVIVGPTDFVGVLLFNTVRGVALGNSPHKS
jgi:ATP-dependent DNA helicase 2 subunit 1